MKVFRNHHLSIYATMKSKGNANAVLAGFDWPTATNVMLLPNLAEDKKHFASTEVRS